jgi:hypothetical protein
MILHGTNRRAEMIPGLRTYTVNARARQPLVDFMTGALVDAGCKIVHTLRRAAPYVDRILKGEKPAAVAAWPLAAGARAREEMRAIPGKNWRAGLASPGSRLV